MACEIKRNEKGEVIAIVCGSPWGIGVYLLPEEWQSYPGESMYGFPPREMNPHDYNPDRESCTEVEIAAWEEACSVWDRAREQEKR